jgi:SAM-dependent methyltransferase
MPPQSNDHSIAQVTSHPRDMTAEDLEIAIVVAHRPDLLGQLVDLARRSFGFYTNHYPYTINYPWVVEKVEGLSRGSRVLDIGAGVSPVPLLLAERGLFVDCVDNHRVIRTPPSAPDWNEWGFFDYGRLHPHLTAHHCDIIKFAPSARFDAIYSVSALAHMTRTVRQKTLRLCRDWLRPKGRLLLAIDVIPATDFLWNRSGGLEVEPPIRHGTVDGLVHELDSLGFQMQESRLLRTVYRSRTDLLFIDCTKGNDRNNEQHMTLIESANGERGTR